MICEVKIKNNFNTHTMRNIYKKLYNFNNMSLSKKNN